MVKKKALQSRYLESVFARNNTYRTTKSRVILFEANREMVSDATIIAVIDVDTNSGKSSNTWKL